MALMKALQCAAIVVCIASAPASAAVANGKSAGGSKVTPIQKVLQMMDSMMQKGEKEKHDEQVQFAAYKQFCDDTATDKQRAIEEAADEIETLEATIEKASADTMRLKKEISQHHADVSTWSGDLAAATKIREKEAKDYEATHQDYSESIIALRQAIEVLKKLEKKGGSETSDETSLAQVASVAKLHLVPEDAKRAINSFLARDSPSDDDLEVPDIPEAPVYEHRSGGIVEMMEQLLEKFTEELHNLEKEESETAHSFEMLKADLEHEIQGANDDIEAKTDTNAKALQAKASAEGDLQDTQSAKQADEKYLADLVATCEKKAADFESRQALRQEELEAIAKAKTIIASEAVSGSSTSLLQKQQRRHRNVALAQLRTSTLMNQAQTEAMKLLQKRARKLNSKVLAKAAARVADDPFTKVKKMIKDLITRLMEEANEEAEHKGWCDTELATNKQTRQEKTEAVDTLAAEIDELEADISKLSEDIGILSEEIAELDKAMANATSLRDKEKAENAATVKDAQEAQTAVASALTILQDFYAKAGEATSLVQEQPEAPPIFDSPYKGMQGESGGVIGMLEVIQSDFARLEADTKAAEVSAQKEYDGFMTDSAVDKESKSTDVEHKTEKKQDKSQALTTKKQDMHDTKKELDAANAYFEKLKPTCVDAGVSYEDRVARRKEEIESLQDALRILNGEDMP